VADTWEITASHHVICEGPDDIALFCRIVRDRGVADVQVGCGRNVESDDKRCLGTGGFANRILALKSLKTPFPQTRGILIVTDGDDSPEKSFRYACDQLQKNGLPVPAKPFEVKADPGQVKTGIITLPDEGRQGGLETLLLECCGFATHSQTNCVTDFQNCVGSSSWPEKNLHKFQLRALIAATHPEDPSMGISFWLSNKNRPFGLDHPALNKITNFLAAFVDATT
jgi:hypothetical protein